MKLRSWPISPSAANFATSAFAAGSAGDGTAGAYGTEGFSTGGGLGCGLPGVKRLMDQFTIDSAPGRGTRVVARKWLSPRP